MDTALADDLLLLRSDPIDGNEVCVGANGTRELAVGNSLKLGQSQDAGQHCGEKCIALASVATERLARASGANEKGVKLLRNTACLQQPSMQWHHICRARVVIMRKQVI